MADESRATPAIEVRLASTEVLMLIADRVEEVAWEAYQAGFGLGRDDLSELTEDELRERFDRWRGVV